MATFEFTDNTGQQVTVKAEDIVHVARPLGSFSGELTIVTGAKWGFGGKRKDRLHHYERAKLAFEGAHEAKKEDRQ